MNNINFRLFGFPVAIQPFFWFLAALLGASSLGRIDNMPVWIAQLAVFMAAVLVSILVHELGHAFTFRYLYHVRSSITIHTFGGFTAPHGAIFRSYGFSGTSGYMFLSFAGPLAGFLLALVCESLLLVIGQDFSAGQGFSADLLRFFLIWTESISIFWGIFNLLPIYPMDGGHIARELFAYLFPRSGVCYSLVLSIIFAAFLAALTVSTGQWFIVALFIYFAWMNYQELRMMH